MRTSRTLTVLSAACAAACAAALSVSMLAGTTTTANAAGPKWADAAKAKITPGVMMYTKGAQCTANFVFTDRFDRVYVGYAAHCAGLGEATDTNGCEADSLPLDTRVRFSPDGNLADGGTTVGRGRLAYTSWGTMRARGTKSANVCAYNDFALVRVNKADVKKVNPSVPVFGGPTGIDGDGTTEGDVVYSYGNSSLRGGAGPLQPKFGTSIGDEGKGWSHTVYTASPGVPGDSGSGFMNADGKALGTLSTLAIAPVPLSNGVGDLAKELAFAQKHSGIAGLKLARGTEPFSPPVQPPA